jgi:hypothetical protein
MLEQRAKKAGIMKRKHGKEYPQIKVITDPKKLAWLKARIEKRTGRKLGTALKEIRPA